MSSIESAPRGRGRLQLIVLALIFSAPVVAAYVFYLNPEWQPGGKTHHGVLQDPAQPLPELALTDAQGQAQGSAALKGKWSLLLALDGPCAEGCQKKLFELRQIRILQNQNIGRVQRVLWAPDAATLTSVHAALAPQAELYHDLVWLAGPGAREFFKTPAPLTVHVIDPLGNWVISYPAETGYQNTLKDLKKLLRLSHIG